MQSRSDIVLLETAKLAKKKGFNWGVQCEVFYILKDSMTYNELTRSLKGYKKDEPSVLAPRQHLLQRWLREKHKIHINIFVNGGNEGDENVQWTCSYISSYHNSLNVEAFSCLSDRTFDTYEDALEDALHDTLNILDEG